MANKKIIINKRVLSPLQEYFFEKASWQINNTIKSIYLISSVALIAILETFTQNIGPVIFYLVGLLLVFYLVFLPQIMKRLIFKNEDFDKIKYKSEIQDILKTSWIVNEEMVRDLLGVTNYINLDPRRVEILKHCYGHSVFNQLKKEAIKENPSVMSHYENPSDLMVRQFMIFPYERDKGYTFKAPYTFKEHSLQDMRTYYRIVNGISIEDKFTTKAVNSKSKESLIKYLDKELVRDIS